MNVKKLREKANKRHLNDKSPREIYLSLGKGKTWFLKWLKRYKLYGQAWKTEHFKGIPSESDYQKTLRY